MKRPFEDVEDALPDASDRYHAVFAMMLAHWHTMHEELSVLKVEVEELTSPPQIALRGGGEALERAVRFLMSSVEKDIEVVATYARGSESPRTRLFLSRMDEEASGGGIFAQWSGCEVMPFELPGRDPPYDEDFPRVAMWRDVDDFRAMALQTLQRGVTGWTLTSVGYNGPREPVLSWSRETNEST